MQLLKMSLCEQADHFIERVNSYKYLVILTKDSLTVFGEKTARKKGFLSL